MVGSCEIGIQRYPRGPTQPHEAYEISKSHDF
jgi:hypothetical protein